MKNHFYALLAAALISPIAHADDTAQTYAGFTLGSTDRANGTSRTGEKISERGRIGAKIFGGYNLNRNFALEAGYGNFGSITLKNTGPGASGDSRIDTSMFYAAGKGTYAINDRFNLYGKVGVAHTRFALTGFGEPDVKMTRPLIGFGGEYNISQQVALTLGYERYGRTKPAPNRMFNLNKIEAGLKFSF
ncbi:outer membrane beta-barrel protein [Massilia glaciei]|uniref:Porin family protein n=1 Tax=Massilia glaciei TaxID=1524097 RepID=A0A2U2HGU5_9BURK|nr:outer membrane beta-barrel protein [Massilia glaciei]PWF44394.1 porin family protein [Massilia glaciei]